MRKLLEGKYRCRGCAAIIRVSKTLPVTRTVNEVVAEATLNRPNPVFSVFSSHLCSPGIHGLADLIEIVEKDDEEQEPQLK